MKKIMDSLSQQFAILGLNGLDSTHPSTAKRAVLRALAAAKLLEQLNETQPMDSCVFAARLEEGLLPIRTQRRRQARILEQDIVSDLKDCGALEEVPDLLACDIYYDTAGVSIFAYRSNPDLYLRISESLRAEILEDGPITWDSFCLLWLLRESCCIHDLFSAEEQNRLNTRLIDLSTRDTMFQSLWHAQFHKSLERLSIHILRGKKNLFRNPYLEGVVLVFPFLERRQAVFIDFVILGTTVHSRRQAVIEYLTERGHYVEEVRNNKETLLKIDNTYYRIFPRTIRFNRIPVQGANLTPVYW